MGSKNSGRMRGVWSAYTPTTSPFGKKYLGDKVYKFPTIKSMEKFDDDVEALKYYYGKGNTLIDEFNEELSYAEAIEFIYNRKFAKWLKTR